MASTVSQRQWINLNLSIVDYLQMVNIDVPSNGKVFCPFHHNTNTPSAKVYVDNAATGIGMLRCYAEQRSYGVFDICTKILQYDDEAIKNLVPQEYWFSVVNVKDTVTEVPIIDEDLKNQYQHNIFGLLHKMDFMYRNPKLFLRRKI